jgi:hypothetical protein
MLTRVVLWTLGSTSFMQLAKHIHIGGTMAGRSTNEHFEQWELESPHRPRFGRNWWFWWPSLRTNGGRFRSHENTDINLHWLCFAAWLTVYAWRCRSNASGEPRP